MSYVGYKIAFDKFCVQNLFVDLSNKATCDIRMGDIRQKVRLRLHLFHKNDPGGNSFDELSGKRFFRLLPKIITRNKQVDHTGVVSVLFKHFLTKVLQRYRIHRTKHIFEQCLSSFLRMQKKPDPSPDNPHPIQNEKKKITLNALLRIKQSEQTKSYL
jgi:hypothetical protein